MVVVPERDKAVAGCVKVDNRVQHGKIAARSKRAEHGQSIIATHRGQNGCWRERRNPSVRALRKLAPELGVRVDWRETGVEPTRFGKFEPAERLLARALRTRDRSVRRDGLLDELRRERAQ